jgi:hypothetical protein
MGKEELAAQFYVMFCAYGRLTILKIGGDIYWLELRLRKSCRGKLYGDAVIRAALACFRGTHHIHFNPRLRCVSRVASEQAWKSQGTSPLLHDSVYFKTFTARKSHPAIAVKIVLLKGFPRMHAYRKGHDRAFVNCISSGSAE